MHVTECHDEDVASCDASTSEDGVGNVVRHAGRGGEGRGGEEALGRMNVLSVGNGVSVRRVQLEAL
jgi:hypothetical protein